MRTTAADACPESRVLRTLLHTRRSDWSPLLEQVTKAAPLGWNEPGYGAIAAALHAARNNGGNAAEHLEDDYAATYAIFMSTRETIETPENVATDARKIWARACAAKINDAAVMVISAPSQAPEILHRLTIETEDTTVRTLPALVDAAQFASEDLPEPAQVVAGMLHRGSKLAVGGGSKSFKTWWLLDLGVSVSHGKPCIGRETTAGRVLYVNFELPLWSIQSRLRAVAGAKQIALNPGCFSLLNLRGKAADFSTLLPKIRDSVKQDFALIILDPIYKLYGFTDENKAGDVAALLNAIEELAASTGAAVAFGAHFSKGNQATKESIDRISGSGVFARDPDSLLMFTKHEEDECFTVEATLRNFPPVKPFAVRWQYPLMVPDDRLDPSRLKQAGGRKAEHSPDDLLKLLSPSGLINKDWLQAADNEGISRRTFFRLRKALEQADKVIQERVSQLWKPVKSA